MPRLARPAWFSTKTAHREASRPKRGSGTRPSSWAMRVATARALGLALVASPKQPQGVPFNRYTIAAFYALGAFVWRLEPLAQPRRLERRRPRLSASNFPAWTRPAGRQLCCPPGGFAPRPRGSRAGAWCRSW